MEACCRPGKCQPGPDDHGGDRPCRRPAGRLRAPGGVSTTGAAALWPPRVLREYAFIADGERGALIGPDGAIAWLCAPRWDSPAVFASLMGGQGGYAVTPSDPWYVWGGPTSRTR